VASPLFEPAGATTAASASTIDFVVGEGTLSSILEESDEEVKALTAALMF
jgi:hypothetical protein